MSGDAVIGEDHFVKRQASSNAVDAAKGRESIERLAGVATMVVPGHDRPFRVSEESG
jgi:hypothetical protein